MASSEDTQPLFPTAEEVNEEEASSSDEGSSEQDDTVSELSDGSSSTATSGPRYGQPRPRFSSKDSWADSTRFDRRSDGGEESETASNLRLSAFDTASVKSSRSSRSSSSVISTSSRRGKSTRKARASRALSTITESWSGPSDQFASPFADIDAQEQPIKEQLARSLDLVNDHATKLNDIEDAISAAMSEVWGYWSDPIQLHLAPPEKVDVQDLIRTDNELFNKVLTVFAVLCDEISELKVTAERNFYPALIMFGHAKHGDDSVVKQGEDEECMGRMLPFFQDVSNFVDRCNSIAINIIHQLASLYHNYQKLWKSTFKHVHFQPVFDGLASLFEVMITIDSIVIDNPNIVTSWDKYKRMMQYVRADPKRYSLTVDRVKQFERLLVSLDQTIMGAQVFQGCIEQDFEAIPLDDDDDEEDEENEEEASIDVRNNRVFLEEFFHCIKERFELANKNIGTASETYERVDLVGTFGLYALYRRLTPPNILPDANFYKQMWEIQGKVPCVSLCGKVVWYSAEFLLKYAPFASKKLYPTDLQQFRREYLQKLDDSFLHDIEVSSAEISSWLVRMESFLQPTTRDSGDTARIVNIRGNLMLKGLVLALRVQNLMHTIMNLHLSLNIPMQKRVVRPLYQCIELLKAIEFMFARKNPIIAESAVHVMMQVGDSLQTIFRPIKAQLEASKKFDDTKLDILAAVTVLGDILRSGESFSYTRIIVLALSTRIACIKTEKNAEIGDPQKALWKLSLLSDFQRKIRRACDCSFFYWSRELLGTFIKDIYTLPEHANRIQYLVGGFLDAVSLINGAQHEESNALHVKAYGDFISEVLEKELVKPLCQDVENDLRLHIHSVHLDHMEAPNPKSADFKVLHYYLDLRPIRLQGTFLDLRQRVTRYLERTFYNLTTVALHDWKTYGEMRNLANDKYGLCLAESHLPMGSLDQGLDILQIMRNIHIFVARYNYNLNQQFFLERRSDKGSRHLNSINIHSIASSIRTHGMGIMNTTVNFTYQFLTKKFDIFSQFLFDEYIKSYLQRERRWYKKHRDEKEVDNKYSYARAFQFNKDIRKLGVSDSGKTFLDQFRLLITEIGNALGYVRMVRSAGMNYCSNAIKFVPDLNTDQFQFEPYVGKTIEKPSSPEEEGDEDHENNAPKVGANLSSETVSAAKNLDAVISNLSKNFSENNDYFSVLVEVFEEVMVNDEQKHLKNFYQILPALTINFVETSVQAKDLMYKNSRRKESYFSDDGFAIGIAYILAILDQGESFDAMHWFDEVIRKFAADEEEFKTKQAEREARKKDQADRKIKETTAELIDDEEEIHTLQLTAKRIEQQRREFDLLNWSVNGARIFFKN